MKGNKKDGLLKAVQSGNDEIILDILDEGFDIDTELNEEGMNALQIACSKNLYDTASNLLFRGANVNYRNEKNGSTALHLATEAGAIDIMEELIANGAELEIEDYMGQTPAHYAVWAGCIESLDLLLGKDIDINISDNCGNTLAILAAEQNRPIMLNHILRKGADLQLSNNDGLQVFDHISSNLTESMDPKEIPEDVLASGCQQTVEILNEKKANKLAIEEIKVLRRGPGWLMICWENLNKKNDSKAHSSILA